MMFTPAGAALTSISISLSSSRPSRSILRNFWRVSAPRAASLSPAPGAASQPERVPGSKASRTRSSAASSARCFTRSISSSRVIFTAASARSRMMLSTSRPT